jgi:membrane protein implicated in regulation of membrane protease activity
MIFRLFIVAAIVLIVFGIIASAADSMQLFSVWWYTWFMASFLAFLCDIALGAFYVVDGPAGPGARRTRTGQPVV